MLAKTLVQKLLNSGGAMEFTICKSGKPGWTTEGHSLWGHPMRDSAPSSRLPSLPLLLLFLHLCQEACLPPLHSSSGFSQKASITVPTSLYHKPVVMICNLHRSLQLDHGALSAAVCTTTLLILMLHHEQDHVGGR